MDLPDVVSLRKFKDFSKQQKEELYETLLELSEAIEELPKKSIRKTLELTLAVLEYKGEQVRNLEEQLETKDKDSLESQYDRLMDENEKLKRMVANLEDDKIELKHKTKELTEEIFTLQKRLREAANADVSDKDSSDPLSELDKQETLLRNINTKNKHIKRLLREIESLQNQNIEQSKTILTLEKDLRHSKDTLLKLKADLTLLESEKKAHKESMDDLNIEIKRLEGNITYLEDERERSENDLKEFVEKLEKKALSWKKMLEEKDKQLKKYKSNKKEIISNEDSQKEEAETKEESEPSEEQEEISKLMHSLESRDKLIEQLEGKIKMMAEEMIASTKLMNKLSAEKEEERNPRKPRQCCKSVELALKASNQKCHELSEMLQKAEEESCLKAKQAMEAVKALTAYQKGEDGLMSALRKCSSLENKLQSRDKQIRALVMELNSMHEIAQENTLLRKRLNIPEDVVITAKNLQAKERSKEKMIEKLTLKLRASEEMRLQLKMEKSDLRKQLLQLQQNTNTPLSAEVEEEVSDFSKTPIKTSSKKSSKAKAQYYITSSPSKEVGEVEDSSNSRETSLLVTACSQCQGNLRVELQDSNDHDLQAKYQEILQENEILRQGMLEILEKLREYDDCSDNITIDNVMLTRLIQTLKSSNSPFDTPKRIREQLALIKSREKALEELLLKQQPPQPEEREIAAEELNSIESMREDGEIRDIEDPALPMPEYLDTSTRPTTPNKSINIPNIAEEEGTAEMITHSPEPEISVPEKRQLQNELEELKIFKKYYEELKLHMNASEMEIMQTYAQLTEQIVTQEQELMRERKSYAYMREDFEHNLSALKQLEIENIKSQAQLKTELLKYQEEAEKLKQDLQNHKNLYAYTTEDYKSLQQALNENQMKLALLTEELLSGKQDVSMKIPELCLDYGIIREDLQLEFITQQEYEEQKQMVKDFEAQRLEMLRKNTQLESLLEIAQEQILSQQRLLNDITDNHVSLRHLVADLQSSTEEKLLMAKMQRDLDAAKMELNHIRNERDTLKLQFESAEQDLISRNQMIEDLNKSFQIERQNNNVKIRFLQKSLCCLKEKYAKFTPLVFLSNFVYAYQNFLKKSTHLSDDKINQTELLNGYIEEVIKAALKEYSLEMEDNQKVIKLVKTETQCKFYEDQLKQYEKKCSELEKELHDVKLKMAADAEHWHTIEALFGTGKAVEKSDNESENNGKQMEQLTKEIGCNTDNIPIPAERKLSASKSRRASKEFVDKNMSPITSPKKINQQENSTQTEIESVAINEIYKAEVRAEIEHKDKTLDSQIKETKRGTCKETTEAEIQTGGDLLSQDSKAIQTLEEVSKEKEEIEKMVKESVLKEALEKLKKTEESLLQAEQQIEVLQEELKTKLKTPPIPEKQEKPSSSTEQPGQPSSLQTDVIEKTIISFHTLLTEKDKSIGKMQDILQNEREQNHLNLNKLNTEIEGLKSTIVNLNFNIKTKDIEILELKTKMETLSVRRNSNEKLELAARGEENVDNSLNEMTDEKIEEMFEENTVPLVKATTADERDTTAPEKHEVEHNREIPVNLLKQLKELKEKASYWESSFKLKEEEIQILKEKIKFLQDREKSTSITHNPEMEQLRSLIEEKDKHINELMDTLNNFHDDQQRYINDSSNYSADQIAKLANDLTRTEATNKIYQTQVEALRKQLNNLTQREKQARDLNQSLRNQLIKRPVVSIKTELNARVKSENLQKRVQQLELDLEDAKAEIQRQKVIIESKRARSANEVGLWEKQKRWQQNAEKFKSKLEETETLLEKTRSLLQSARNTINRLEKDKQILEAKLSRITQHNVQHSMKCCRTPSCPNLHHQTSSMGSGNGGKYTPSESPETYTGASSECSSPGRSSLPPHCSKAHFNNVALQNPHNDIIEALKARIEMQQRKILALELEGKGSNALTTEMEKLQEKLSSVEAQNIRLEAKNLQLQLDNDLLRQGDGTERLQKRIKHLEDYIIALKEERASAEARKELCKCSGIKLNTQMGQPAETTILSLRNLVEKLKAENKYLKDGRRSCESRASTETATTTTTNDTARLQQMYSDSLEKISTLQTELKLQTKCPHCENKGRMLSMDMQAQDELKYVKEQLIKKSQLLQKAKVLLTRAAAKEKVLKEQLAMWKRKCSELQNVPVIDEISE
ncbi:centrosomal protein cep290 [Lucilia cuprina]|uniref:centrosomal protein cep290 n=1 Tax=Lucilia cuprina TaxID=7375 RepID=UPI001F05F0DB|nr:centrosomal protein cep290 [Lucilia cuprina]